MHAKNSAWLMLCAVLIGAGTLLAPRSAEASLCWMTPYGPKGWCMSEGGQMANNFKLLDNFKKELDKVTSLIKTLEEETQQFKQLDVGGFKLGEQAGSRFTLDGMSERGIDDGVDEVCQKGKSSVAQEQYALCKAQVQLRNKRFNLMVKMFAEVEKRDKALDEIRSNRDSLKGAEDNGKLSGNGNASLVLKASMKNDYQSYLGKIQAYTSMIDALDSEMAQLANRALTNKPGKGWAGQAVQGIALTAGLKAAKNRDL